MISFTVRLQDPGYRNAAPTGTVAADIVATPSSRKRSWHD
jgi:hypothetical protein